MPGPFKVQKLTQTNTFSKTQKLKSQQSPYKNSLGEVTLSIPTIPILKYDSHALIEILASFFDNCDILPSYRQVQKALQIISLTTNDEILFSDIQSLILRNTHKKSDVYIFFCLWSQYLSIQSIIGKFSSPKTQQKIVYTIVYVYISDFSTGVAWYQNLAIKHQIGMLFNVKTLLSSKIIQEIDGEIANLKLSGFNHFQSIILKINSVTTFSPSSKVLTLIQKMFVNFIKNPKNSQFLDQAAQKFISNQKNQRKDSIICLLEFTNQNNLREISEIITNTINKSLSNKFNSENNQIFFNFIESVFQKLQRQNIGQNYLTQAVKNWFLSIEQNLLWNFFNANFAFKFNNFSQVKSKEVIQKRTLMLDIFSELSKQNQKIQKQVQRIIYSQYLYQFFEGKPFDFTIQSKFLQSQTQTKFFSERETILKVLRQIKNEKFLNIMTFNKASFPGVIDWLVDISFKEVINKYSSLSGIKKLLNQLNEHWQKIESQMLKENKKIQLLFSVIRVSIDKVIIFVTVLQLAELLKSFYEGKNLNLSQISHYKYRQEYKAVSEKDDIKKNKSILINKNEQIHPIIMQAKIVKLLKKSLKKASVQEIAQSLNFDKQKIHQACKKLVNKGFLEQNQDETYSYQP